MTRRSFAAPHECEIYIIPETKCRQTAAAVARCAGATKTHIVLQYVCNDIILLRLILQSDINQIESYGLDSTGFTGGNAVRWSFFVVMMRMTTNENKNAASIPIDKAQHRAHRTLFRIIICYE